MARHEGPSEDVQRAAGGIAERAIAFARLQLGVLWTLRGESRPVRTPEVDRDRIEDLVARLQRVKGRRRVILIEESSAFQDWRLCVRLCDESERVAAHSAPEALRWARLAGEVARRVSGSEAWRSRVRGYAEAFLGNAHRVGNEYQAAREAFERWRRLWREGRDDEGRLDPGRPTDLEASLWRGLRRFDEAIRLHDEALDIAWPDQRGVILLNKSATLEEKGDYEGSIEALRMAASLEEVQRGGRPFCVLRFNLAGNLIRLGRAEEALPIVGEVRELVERLQNDLDRVRTRWLDGTAWAGVGQRAAAAEALQEVRRAFVERSMPFDLALASLDLARVYRDEGRVEEVQALAVEMVAIFAGQEVYREAMAALVLFQEAAARGAVTEELVRRLQEYLGKVRGNPGLRFGG